MGGAWYGRVELMSQKRQKSHDLSQTTDLEDVKVESA